MKKPGHRVEGLLPARLHRRRATVEAGALAPDTIAQLRLDKRYLPAKGFEGGF
jgi:hypothetical protein